MTSTRDPLVLGIDGGTESIRVALFDARGRQVAISRQPYPTRFPRPGRAEQDPDDWWRNLRSGVREVVAAGGAAPADVVGVSVAATSYTMVCADARGVPLRPALLWMDSRADEEAARVAATGSPALRYTGGDKASAEWMLGKAMWLARHEPDVYASTTWVADYAEWLTFRLTGLRTASANCATTRCYYDRLAGGWPLELWDSVGLPDLHRKLPAEVIGMGEVVGGLPTAVAAELGLAPGTPVAQGGADAFVAMLGMGVTEPGTVAMVTGSSHVQMLQTAEPQYGAGLFGSYTDAVIPGQFTVDGGQIATGAMVSWYAKLLRAGSPGAGTAPDGDLGPVFDALNEKAAALPPGSDGVLALDHWQGNRTPHVDPLSRGMVWGLGLGHGPHHVYRALVEAVCFGTELVVRSMREAGNDVQEVVACGGALRSPLWLQLHADVSGLPIRTTAGADVTVLGAAVLAAAGAGLHPSLRAAAAAMVRPGRTVEPRPGLTEAYRPWLQLYEESYAAMAPLMHRATVLASHRS